MDKMAFSELVLLNASIPKYDDKEEPKVEEVTGKQLFERFNKK